MRTAIAFFCLILFSSSIYAKDNNDCSSIKGVSEEVSFSGLSGSFNIENFLVSKNVVINNVKVSCEFRTGIPINWSASDESCYGFDIVATGYIADEKELELNSLSKCSRFK